MSKARYPAGAAALFVMVSGTAAAFSYSEPVSGDLSNDRLSPSVLTAVEGSNSLSLTSGSLDRDYFTFNVAPGFALDAIVHESYTSTDLTAFFGMQAGTQLTEDPATVNPANLLGYTHFGVATDGTDIMDNLANSNLSIPAAMGFTAPLPAGDYVFWVQQAGAAASYTFDFELTAVPVPLPAVGWLLGGAFALLGARRRRIVG